MPVTAGFGNIIVKMAHVERSLSPYSGTFYGQISRYSIAYLVFHVVNTGK